MQELFSIIPNLPGVRVLDIGGEPKLFKQLESFCRTKEHELHTIIFDNTPLQSDYATIRHIPINKERYNQRSIQYDTIFVDYPLEKIDDLELFFKKIYRIMKNGAKVIIFTQNIEELTMLLEKLNFVAINPIEIEDKVVLTAKKMHGWARV